MRCLTRSCWRVEIHPCSDKKQVPSRFFRRLVAVTPRRHCILDYWRREASISTPKQNETTVHLGGPGKPLHRFDARLLRESIYEMSSVRVCQGGRRGRAFVRPVFLFERCGWWSGYPALSASSDARDHRTRLAHWHFNWLTY